MECDVGCRSIPWMEAVLDNLLPVLPPLVAIIQYIHIASGLEAKPRFPHLPPHLHPSSFLPRCCRRRALPPACSAHHINRCRCVPNQIISANERAPRRALETLTIGQPHYVLHYCSQQLPSAQEATSELWCEAIIVIRTYQLQELGLLHAVAAVLAISPVAFAAAELVPACENQDYKDQGEHPTRTRWWSSRSRTGWSRRLVASFIYLAGIERPGAGGGSLLAGGGDGGAERDAGKKQRVQEAAVVVVVRREHQAMIIRSLLLDKRHLQKHVLLVRQRGKKGMRMGAWRRSNRVEASRKAGLQQLAAAPLHARI